MSATAGRETRLHYADRRTFGPSIPFPRWCDAEVVWRVPRHKFESLQPRAGAAWLFGRPTAQRS